MPYEVKITDIDTLETYETKIEELKELKEILERYKEKTIELDVVNTEVKRVRERKQYDRFKMWRLFRTDENYS